VQERISLVPNIHKCGIETGQHFSDSTKEYIPDRVAVIALVTVQLCELPIFH
jgi:hypothetical protein